MSDERRRVIAEALAKLREAEARLNIAEAALGEMAEWQFRVVHEAIGEARREIASTRDWYVRQARARRPRPRRFRRSRS
jgi:hypothetical protein